MTHSKKIDRILKNYFFKYEFKDDVSHFNLCFVFENTKYEESWDDFWDKVNTRNYCFLSSYFLNYEDLEKSTLLRLLLVEEFKQYLDNGCQFK